MSSNRLSIIEQEKQDEEDRDILNEAGFHFCNFRYTDVMHLLTNETYLQEVINKIKELKKNMQQETIK